MPKKNKLSIKILGTGCPNCQKLEANTKEAVEELGLDAKIEKITEIADIMSYRVMSMPVLVVDEEVKISGYVPEKDEIKNTLKA
jgi:small redox-active disulfide protein 2